MQSPLPDSSALEAGILEDPMPSRLSRVQENVRDLLRNPRFGGVSSIPSPTAVQQQFNMSHGIPTSPISPNDHTMPRETDLVSPSSASTSSYTTWPVPTSIREEVPSTDTHSQYRRGVQDMAYQSALFNSRAIAALNHPDLSDPSLIASLRKTEHRHRHSWKRSRHVSVHLRSKRRRQSSWFFCVMTALLLAAIVATYVVVATTSNNVTSTFHVLFVLAILLSGMVCAYAVGRLVLASSNASVHSGTSAMSRSRRWHRRDHNGHSRHHRSWTTNSFDTDSSTFIPSLPIRVHGPGEEIEVRPDSREARATTMIRIADQTNPWDKPADTVANPPPAYGRWRGSVRANPDLLHWRAVPSPTHPTTPGLPSPTYEEAVRNGVTEPLSYATRISPARDMPAQDVRLEPTVYQPPSVSHDTSPEPEMFEIRRSGVGIAL